MPLVQSAIHPRDKARRNVFLHPQDQVGCIKFARLQSHNISVCGGVFFLPPPPPFVLFVVVAAPEHVDAGSALNFDPLVGDVVQRHVNLVELKGRLEVEPLGDLLKFASRLQVRIVLVVKHDNHVRFIRVVLQDFAAPSEECANF